MLFSVVARILGYSDSLGVCLLQAKDVRREPDGRAMTAVAELNQDNAYHTCGCPGIFQHITRWAWLLMSCACKHRVNCRGFEREGDAMRSKLLLGPGVSNNSLEEDNFFLVHKIEKRKLQKELTRNPQYRSS